MAAVCADVVRKNSRRKHKTEERNKGKIMDRMPMKNVCMCVPSYVMHRVSMSPYIHNEENMVEKRYIRGGEVRKANETR